MFHLKKLEEIKNIDNKVNKIISSEVFRAFFLNQYQIRNQQGVAPNDRIPIHSNNIRNRYNKDINSIF